MERVGDKMDILRGLLDLCFPIKCPFCNTLISSQVHLCAQCEKEIMPAVTSTPQRWELQDGITCLAPLWYSPQVQEGILRYKFQGAKHYYLCFGELMSQVVEDSMDFDYITFVPLSKKRKKFRGFNQAELLARVVAENKSLELVPLLEKHKHNKAQSSIEDDSSRAENTKDVYRVLTTAPSIENKHILLVDDVITTGATIVSCVRELQAVGARQVTCLSFARARK